MFYYDDAFLIGNYIQNKKKLSLLTKKFNDIGININRNKTKIFIGKHRTQQRWMQDYNLNKNFNIGNSRGIHR